MSAITKTVETEPKGTASTEKVPTIVVDAPSGGDSEVARGSQPRSPTANQQKGIGETAPGKTSTLKEVVATASAAAPPPQKEPIRRPPLKGSGAPGKAQPEAQELTFAQAVGGAAGSAKSRAQIPQITARHITPRAAPPTEQLKNRSQGNLQDLFHKRWHSAQLGVCFEMLRGVNSEKYLEAIAKVVPLHNIFAMGPLGQGTVLVTLNNEEAVNELLSKGIEVNGRHLLGFPEARRPTRVVLSPVPVWVDDQCLTDFLSGYGKIQGRVRGLPLRLGEKGLARGIFSLSREAFITLNPGAELPAGVRLTDGDNTSMFVEITTDLKCFRCRQIGHTSAQCPGRVAKSPAPQPGKQKGKVPDPKSGKDSPSQAGNAAGKDAQKAGPSNEAGSCLAKGSSSEEETQDGAAKSRRKRKRSKKKQGTVAEDAEKMPPPPPKVNPAPSSSGQVLSVPVVDKTPSGSEAEKRRRSDDGEDEVPAPKVTPVLTRKALSRPAGEPALPIGDQSDVSDAEMVPLARERARSNAGCESDTSAVSVASQGMNVDGPLTRIQLRALVRYVSSKKNMETFKAIVASYTQRYYELITQLQALSGEAREQRQYNQEAKLGRIIAKIEQIALEADDRRPEERQAPAPPSNT